MIKNTVARILLYTYGGLITAVGFIGVIIETIQLPGYAKVFVLTWVPLIWAYWAFMRSKRYFKPIYWRFAVGSAFALDLINNFYLAPRYAEDVDMGVGTTAVALLFFAPLYGVAAMYAWNKTLWQENIEGGDRETLHHPH